MEQEVRRKKKTEIKFEPNKVFGVGAQHELGQSLEPQAAERIEDIAREVNETAATYRAKKGEGGDRSAFGPYYHRDRDSRARRGLPRE